MVLSEIHLPAGIFLLLAVTSGVGNFMKVSGKRQSIVDVPFIAIRKWLQFFLSCSILDVFLYDCWGKTDVASSSEGLQGILASSKDV